MVYWKAALQIRAKECSSRAKQGNDIEETVQLWVYAQSCVRNTGERFCAAHALAGGEAHQSVHKLSPFGGRRTALKG